MKIIKDSSLKVAHWPWAKMDMENVCLRATLGEVYMPNIGYIKVDRSDSWKAELGDAANSKRLWINSLVTSHALLKLGRESQRIDYVSLAGDFVKSYFDFCDRGDGVFVDAWKDEHAVSNRLFVLTAFLVDSLKYHEEEVVSQARLIYIAERHANWLADEKNYVKNNHGVMMDLALAQFGLFIKLIDMSMAEKYIEIAINRLGMMFDLTFDAEGCCTENSPSYHFVNYSLFSAIEQFLNKHDLLKTDNQWKLTLSKARKVGNLFMRPDGSIPVIGDSEKKVGTFFPYDHAHSSDFGVGYYPEAGFFVAKSGEFQLTLRAGGASLTGIWMI